MQPDGYTAMRRHIATGFAAAFVGLVLLTGSAWSAVYGGNPSPPGKQPPSNLTPPTITGSAQVGATLAASSGTWSGNSLKYAYQWQRCNSSGGSCTAIGGATQSSYQLASADAGSTVRVSVTATNQNGSASAVSAVTAAVTAPATVTAPSNTAAPSISGTAQQGQTLSASTGTWNGTTPMSYAYQWQRCNSSGGSCAAISGATAGTYQTTSSDVGSTLRVAVTASNSAGSANAVSAATAAISGTTATPTATAPSNATPPSISGVAQQGQTLSASTGTWNGTTPMSYAYQWQRCNSTGGSCTAISGATGSSYLLGSGDVGYTLRVSVTASNSAGSATAVSAATAVVAGTTSTTTAPTDVSLPTITGIAQQGQTLTASTGTWNGATPLTYAYQWQRCDTSGGACSLISGATAGTYVVASADGGYTLRVSVTASNSAGSATAVSAATAVVTAVAPSDTTLPSISGTAQQGQTLSASTGTWNGTTPMSYAYQWQRCNSSGGSCTAISGATASSYQPTSTDVGSTLRTTVTASNVAGSATATSAATGAVTGSTSTAASYTEHFDGSFTNAFWTPEPAGAMSFTAGWLNQAITFTDCAVSAPGACTTSGATSSSSSYGQLSAASAVSMPTGDVPGTGRIPGSGTGCCDGNGSSGADWYRVHIYFPSGYLPTPGEQNSLFELHVDAKTESDAASVGQGAYSAVVTVASDLPAGYTLSSACPGTPMLCTVAGVNPRLELKIRGSSTPGQYAVSQVQHAFSLPGGSLQTNHWYDVVLHLVWNTDPSVGYVQWWVDGQKIADQYMSTLYTRSDGSHSYAQNIETLNYRLWAKWAASVSFDELAWGPTASSIGFTP